MRRKPVWIAVLLLAACGGEAPDQLGSTNNGSTDTNNGFTGATNNGSTGGTSNNGSAGGATNNGSTVGATNNGSMGGTTNNGSTSGTTNTHGDLAAVVASPAELTTREDGPTVSFQVTLQSTPLAPVTITATSSDPSEGTVSEAVVLEAGQLTGAFVVTPQSDVIVDGNPTYLVTLEAGSADPEYDGLPISPVSVRNLDANHAVATITPTQISVDEGGAPTTFSVVLRGGPGEEVAVDLWLSDASRASLSTSTLTFNDRNFHIPQSVTVSAVDNLIADGDVSLTVHTTVQATGAYVGLQSPDVTLLVSDDDSAGATVTAIDRITYEWGSKDGYFDVVLTSEPTDDVTIGLSSSVPTEGVPAVSSITFTPADWNVAQRVAVHGVDDEWVDGEALYAIVVAPMVSNDPAYHGIDLDDVYMTNFNDEHAIFIVEPTQGLTTSEDGTTASFTVRTACAVREDVTIPIVVTEPGEVAASTTSITITPQNWMNAQTVTLTGLDDTVADGDQSVIVVLGTTSSLEAAYDQLDPANVSVINLDND